MTFVMIFDPVSLVKKEFFNYYEKGILNVKELIFVNFKGKQDQFLLFAEKENSSLLLIQNIVTNEIDFEFHIDGRDFF